MVAAQSLSAEKERLVMKNFDCVTMHEDPVWYHIQSRNVILESKEMLAQIVEKNVEILNR